MSFEIFYKFIVQKALEFEIPLSDINISKKTINGLYLGNKNHYGRFLDFEGLKNQRMQILNQFKNASSIYNFYPDCKSNLLKQEVLIFVEKLKLWSQYLCENNLFHPMKVDEIFIRCLSEGPAFADYLKDYFAFSIRGSWGIDYTLPDKQDAFLRMKDINQIYPHIHLINFSRPKDYSDLLDYSFKESKLAYDPNSLRPWIKKNLKAGKNLRDFDALDSLKLSNAQGLDEGSNLQIRAERGTKLYGSDHSKLCFRIESVTKTCSESRTIAIPGLKTRDFLYEVRENYKNLLDAKDDYYGAVPWEVEKHLHNEKDRIFFMFDQKKCGWTFPMELMIVFFEELYDLYPTYTQFKDMSDIFRDRAIFYSIDDVIKTPKRGFILGMFDDAVSFIMACLWEKFIDEINSKTLFNLEELAKGFFFGDDCLISLDISTGLDYHKICREWVHFLDEHGIVINIKKSFLGSFGIFCEIYGFSSKFITQKHTTYLLNVLNIWRAFNTAHAKNLANGLETSLQAYLNFIPQKIKVILERLIKQSFELVIGSFPKEFFDKEYLLPYEIGGWFTTRENGKNTILSRLYSEEFSNEFLSIAMLRPPKMKFEYISSKKMRNSVLEILRNDYNRLEVSKLQNLLDDEDYYSYCCKLANRDSVSLSKMWWDFQLTRMNLFKNPPRHSLEYQKIFLKDISNQKITEFMVRKRPEISINIGRSCHKKPKWLRYEIIEDIGQPRSFDMLSRIYYNKYYIEGCKFHSQVNITDCFAQCCKDLAKNKYFIPYDWFELCYYTETPIELMYKNLQSYGYDMAEYEPKVKFEKNKPMHFTIHSTNKDSQYIYFDKNVRSFIKITFEEMVLLSHSENMYNWFYKSIIQDALDHEWNDIMLWIERYPDPISQDVESDSDDDLLNELQIELGIDSIHIEIKEIKDPFEDKEDQEIKIDLVFQQNLLDRLMANIEGFDDSDSESEEQKVRGLRIETYGSDEDIEGETLFNFTDRYLNLDLDADQKSSHESWDPGGESDEDDSE